MHSIALRIGWSDFVFKIAKGHLLKNFKTYLNKNNFFLLQNMNFKKANPIVLQPFLFYFIEENL